MAEEQVEKFAQNGGQVTGTVGLLVCAAMVVVGVADWHHVPHWVPPLGLFLGVLVYATVVRPRVMVTPGTLVLRNMLETIKIPLAAVEEVAVRQVMAVRVGEHRYVCPGAGRSLRQALKGSAAQNARKQAGGWRGAFAMADAATAPGMVYGDFIELRLRDLIAEDRMRRRVAAYSPELDALSAEVMREPALPLVAALAVTAALVVVGLVV